MKNIFTLCMALMAFEVVQAEEKTVWEGSEAISWNTDYYPGTQLDTFNDDELKTIFVGLAQGDVIRLYTTTTYSVSEVQYSFRYKAGSDWSWEELAMSVADGIASYTVESGEMATWIAERGLVVTGQAYTLTKITIETPEAGGETTETDLTVQEGASPLPLTLLSDWSAFTTFAATQFASAKAGDVLTVYVSGVEEGAQLSLKDMSNGWPALDETTAYPSVATDATTYTYTFTAETIAKVQANSLVISGQKLTVDRVTLSTTSDDNMEPATGETYVAWTGEKVFTSEWSVWQEVGMTAFAKTQTGMLLRVKFKDLKAGAQLQMSDGSWTVLPGVEVVNISGIYQDYDITAERLAVLQEKGLIISGTNFTLTSVEVINPADLKPLTLSVPVTGNWIYTDAPTFTIHAVNPYDEAVTANAAISIATDKMVPVTTITKSVEIAAGGAEDIEMTCTEPLRAGFYKATCTVNDDLARAFFFGVNPTEIVSAPDMQADFESFWQAAKAELAAIEATDEPVLTKIESHSTDKRTVYLVEFKSVSNGDGVAETVRGYYAEPNDGKKHPVIMHYQGYDSGYRPGEQGVEPWCLSGDGDEASANYAEFILSTRGQSVNNRPASERADGIDRDFTNTYGDWFAYNFGDKDKYYYRGAYMDCVRAIDFMASRPTSDMTNLYAEGQSQGGAFTYAAAALSGREFKAIAPGIAFMGDFPDYFEIVNWPAYVARENQGSMTDAEMYAFLSYFDTKNLATFISNKMAVIATIGVQDNVCPPHTNIAPYNNLPDGTEKQITFNPENGHQVADTWYSDYMTFFASKYVEPDTPSTGISHAVADQNGLTERFNLSGQRVDDTYTGLVIVKGKTFVAK